MPACGYKSVLSSRAQLDIIDEHDRETMQETIARSLVRYRVKHSKTKFISTREHVTSFKYFIRISRLKFYEILKMLR